MTARASYDRPWTALAWALAALAWVTVVGAVVVLVAAGSGPSHVADWVMDLTTAVVYGGVVVMMLPRTRHPVVWLLALTALGCAAAGLATGYVALDGGWPGQHLAFYAQYWAWVPGVYATVTLVPLLAVPGAASRWPAITAAVALILVAVLPTATLVAPGLPPNPLGLDVDGWQSAGRWLGLWPDRAVALTGGAVWLWLALRTRRAGPGERHGLGWLLAGHAAMVLALAVFLLPWPDAWMSSVAEVSGTLLLLAQLFLPAALLVLVLGRQLWGVDARVDRGVVWLMMTVASAVAYLVLLGATAILLPDDSDVGLALAVGIVALGATPLRRMLQRRVDRLVYGTGADPARLMSSLGERDEVDLDGLAGALRGSLRLEDVSILPVDDRPDDALPSAVAPDDLRLTLTSRGRDVGVLVARPRPGERLDQRTARMLGEVAGLVGVTIDLLQSVDALTAARSRMADVRHEERRLLRRDLHDGLGPALAGIRLGLVAARGLRERDPAAADEMLEALERELAAQGEEVRRLSRSLVPLALEDGDLEAALGGLAERFTADDLSVEVTVAPDVDLAPPVQVAVYQMASEALLNVSRHARASRCEVHLRRRADGATVFAVTDDGIGLAADRVEGIGLRSMRERAEELGAVLRLGAPAGGAGSRVELRLPAR